MKSIISYRLTTSDQGTKSRAVTSTNKSFCILELPWRDNRSNYSCIKPGEYLCVPYKSRKFGNTYLLTDTEGRTYILTHSGNLAGDTLQGWKTHSHGCLIIGSRFGKLKVGGSWQVAVLNSKSTMRKLRTEMSSTPFMLKIIDLTVETLAVSTM